jgi:hypothetical protein
VSARRRARGAGTQIAPLLQAVRDNAFVGVAAAMLVGTLLGAGAIGLLACATLGAAVGAVLGVLHWVEAADLPEAPIPAVARFGSRDIPERRARA